MGETTKKLIAIVPKKGRGMYVMEKNVKGSLRKDPVQIVHKHKRNMGARCLKNLNRAFKSKRNYICE